MVVNATHLRGGSKCFNLKLMIELNPVALWPREIYTLGGRGEGGLLIGLNSIYEEIQGVIASNGRVGYFRKVNHDSLVFVFI